MQRLHKFLKLTMGDRLLLIGTFIVLAAIRLGLLLLPFHVLLQLLNSLSQISLLRSFPYQTPASKVVWAVEVSSYYIASGVKCLARALTTKLILNWCGCNPNLCIGVAKTASGKLEAHAWVEHHDQVLIGNLKDLARFTPLPRINGGKS